MLKQFGLLCLLPLAAALPVQGQQVLFHDDFNGTALDQSVWWHGRWVLGRTQLDGLPTVANGMATLHLNSFNPANPGATFVGNEMYTAQAFPVGGGLEMDARVRTNSVPDGVVSSFFADNFRPDGNDEIDFEALSSQNNHQSTAASSLLLTTWHDWGAPGSQYFDGIHHSDQSVTIPGLNLAQFNTFTIRWYPDHTEWLVNGQLLRSTTLAHAVGPMQVHLNFWAPPAGWDAAFSPTLLATANPLLAKDLTYDVDWVTVKSLAAPIVGDANRDGVVNIYDLLAVLQHYGDSGTTWSTGDFDGNGKTNFADLTGLVQHFTLPAAGAAPFVVTAPEPSAIAAAFGLPLLLRRARRPA